MIPYDQHWTLFLDRDGVLNRRLPGAYVRHWGEWQWVAGDLDVLPALTARFGRTVVVTNQQGIGKGLMSEADLTVLHQRMLARVAAAGARIDGVYHCPDLATVAHHCRKPHPALAQWAQRDFPAIDFARSVMVGDSRTDLQFGRGVGMRTVLIECNPEEVAALREGEADERWASLRAWAQSLVGKD